MATSRREPTVFSWSRLAARWSIAKSSEIVEKIRNFSCLHIRPYGGRCWGREIFFWRRFDEMLAELTIDIYVLGCVKAISDVGLTVPGAIRWGMAKNRDFPACSVSWKWKSDEMFERKWIWRSSNGLKTLFRVWGLWKSRQTTDEMVSGGQGGRESKTHVRRPTLRGGGIFIFDTTAKLYNLGTNPFRGAGTHLLAVECRRKIENRSILRVPTRGIPNFVFSIFGRFSGVLPRGNLIVWEALTYFRVPIFEFIKFKVPRIRGEISGKISPCLHTKMRRKNRLGFRTVVEGRVAHQIVDLGERNNFISDEFFVGPPGGVRMGPRRCFSRQKFSLLRSGVRNGNESAGTDGV